LFRKLKIQLVLINLALLCLVLVAIFSGIYFSTEQGMERQSQDLMSSVAESEQMLPPQGHGLPGPPGSPPRQQQAAPNFFYLKVGNDGQILDVSPHPPISTSDARGLIKKAVAEASETGTISFKNIDYRYLKTSKNYGYFLVFDDKTNDEQVLSGLVVNSLIIGGLSLILVFFVSLFLANKALVPITRAWDKQKAFVADASHELRTPLAVINTNLELVLGNADETVDSQSKWLGAIQSEIQRMSKLVADLLFLARADSNEAIPMSVFNLSDALNQAAVPFIPFAATKGIDLVSKIEPDIFFYGNEGRLKQLIDVLIDNAIKYTPVGDKVELKLHAGCSTIEITVSDTGEGIPGEHLGRIFERFYRIDKSRSREYGGTGLGLSIADSIVKEHKGAIGVSSSAGKGAVFSITLPKPKHES